MENHYRTKEIDAMEDWERRAYQRDLAMTIMPFVRGLNIGSNNNQWIRALNLADSMIDAEHEHERKIK